MMMNIISSKITVIIIQIFHTMNIISIIMKIPMIMITLEGFFILNSLIFLCQLLLIILEYCIVLGYKYCV